MESNELYQTLGVSRPVLDYGNRVLEQLKPRFAEIDDNAESNQLKVIAAMQKNRVDATCFAATTGYGYNDVGREKLERVYADAFHTEAALGRAAFPRGTALRHPPGGHRHPG